MRYSQPYQAGERGEAGCVRWLLATLAAVFVVVATNHLLVLALAWSSASLALHELLNFFAERPAALTAAHKKFVLGRVADVAMLGACALLAASFATLQIDTLLARAAAADALPVAAQAADALVAVTAPLECPELPFHGWLIQVMEAPTPVSAPLHAGIVDLDGFVPVRLAPMVADVPPAAGLLVVAGAFTAVVAALVMTTPIGIKVALAWSACAPMGVMLVQCGIGLWEMALLHLVAHSLHEVHAFFGAGGVVRQTLKRQLAPAVAPASLAALLVAGLGAPAKMAVAALDFGLRPESQPAASMMGGIVALALTPMLRPAPGGTAFVVAPRSHTRGLDLGGRSFRHDYDLRQDPTVAVLEMIMTAPMVVANWINLQYHASTVDNRRYGSSDEVLRNVVGGRLGVFECNGGDLRIGLPLQSLHDGRTLRHTPLRPSVFRCSSVRRASRSTASS